jgi:transposase
MGPKLDQEARMTIKKLSSRGVAKTEIARLLGVSEGSVRYHLCRQAAGLLDGRSQQRHLAEDYEEKILVWLEQLEGTPLNLAALYEWLVEEHRYPGSSRSLQRYFAAHFPKPRLRARRRVETPPGAQGQLDWAEFPRMRVAGEELELYAFHHRLSHSRMDAVIWSLRKDQLSWHHVHNEAFRRLDGIAATLRVDNEKTAVSRGAGPWGEINDSYRGYARAVGFHIDPCLPGSPHHKGKVERAIRTSRGFDPTRREWDSLEELQAITDRRTVAGAKRRLCPATGTTVFEAWEAEKEFLAPVPILPEPFDVAVTRPVSEDCLIAFEARQYSVPFYFVKTRVEVRGCAREVQILAEGRIVARHPRHTKRRILIDPRHFEGDSTDRVLAPTPLGRLGRRLQEIATMAPERRPLDLYAALAEVAR